MGSFVKSNDPIILHHLSGHMSISNICKNDYNTPFKFLKHWVIVPTIGGLVIATIESHTRMLEGSFQTFLQSTLISSVFWSVLANGNNLIINWLDLRWTWLEHPIKRVIFGISALLVYTPIASLSILAIYVEWILGYSITDVIQSQGLPSLLAMPLGITIFITIVQHGQGFLLEWRQAAINVEKLKNENLKSKFESLKSQVNPHFLFNSLNALTSLVYADQNKAVHFIQKLSEVYRYVLDHQNDEVVPLQIEMEFLRSFVYLNQIRFGDNFEVIYKNLDTFSPQETVPPVALQMLIENCIKHNEISKEKHLLITVERKNNQITVANNINPIHTAKQDASGLGLNNIVSRYHMLSNQKVEVNPSDTSFQVTIPILEFES
ncbi:histidine kinase [Reichenbachiella carrageenanivorans]|uniref:Histidine kinase n=1 Tax=Reichenbachiella carrageenanivorans TaxID=2979869 RepID=A0ABY6CZ06_9BACT|nr:histidine kinase [Reichenbachiella carrageenanivorans]UXX79154.1 histidine kinase [Reichenbachiella carrageenanivorans]